MHQVDIWFQDEARFGQQVSISRMWAIKGTKLRAIQVHLSFWRCMSASGDTVGLLLPYANTDAIRLHLAQIAQQFPKGRHVV